MTRADKLAFVRARDKLRRTAVAYCDALDAHGGGQLATGEALAAADLALSDAAIEWAAVIARRILKEGKAKP